MDHHKYLLSVFTVITYTHLSVTQKRNEVPFLLLLPATTSVLSHLVHSFTLLLTLHRTLLQHPSINCTHWQYYSHAVFQNRFGECHKTTMDSNNFVGVAGTSFSYWRSWYELLQKEWIPTMVRLARSYSCTIIATTDLRRYRLYYGWFGN
jgi:hypothetical protein